jgi:drug/metabolite transporter (DMT)-like permease
MPPRGFNTVPASPIRIPMSRRRLGMLAALLTVWLLFGSGFIGVKVGVTHVPPLLFAGSRFVVAGAILLAWSAWRGGWRLDLRPADVGAAGLAGIGLIVGGQGSVSWAAQYVAPGILAVLVTLVPIWVGLISWLVLRRPIPLPAVAGMVVAFAGVVFLASPAGGTGTAVGPALLVALGSVSWAAASVYASRTAISRRPVLASGVQLLAGGTAQVLIGVALGEPRHLHAGALAGPAGLAWLFLLIGPSVIAFPLFTWLLTHAAPAVANTQAYVSPVVALALGWLLLGSPVTPLTAVAAAVILASVALIVTTSSRPAPERAERQPDRRAA